MPVKQIYLPSLLIICAAILSLFQQCTKPDLNETAISSSSTDDMITGTIAEGTYKISIAGIASKAVALTNTSVDDNEPVAVKPYNEDSTNTLWHFTPVGNYFRISNAYSGKVLSSATKTAGAQLIQNRYDTGAAQLWKAVSYPHKTFRFINKATGFVMGVNINSDKGAVEQQAAQNLQSQFFQLTQVQAIYQDVDATNFFRRTEGWIASDGAASVVLNNGSVAWFMGDSHIDDYFYNSGKVYCLFQVRNAALLQPAGKSWYWPLTQTLTGNPYPGTKSYLKNKASDDYWMWPGCGFQPPGNDTLYVYNQPLKKTGSGAWAYGDDSLPVFAKIHTPDMKVAEYSYLQDFDGINFGLGFVKEDDGYVYAYGIKQTFIYCNIYVARFPARNPNAKWSFWTGSGWSKNIKDIKRVSEGASNGVAVSKYKDFYVAISTEFSVGCDQGLRIYAAVSRSPTGPFTKRKEFYQIPDRLEGHAPFFYAPNIHPQFENNNNELLITYDINGYGDCVNTCKAGKMDPDCYRPKAIRVPLSVMAKYK